MRGWHGRGADWCSALGTLCGGGGKGVDVMFQADPGNEGGAEGEVEEAFVGDGEYDEHGSEGQADHSEAVDVVVLRLETVEERDGERGD